VAYAQRIASEMDQDAMLLVNLSGRGDKDVNTVEKALGTESGMA
jgi:tryptophan synthase beta chain